MGVLLVWGRWGIRRWRRRFCGGFWSRRGEKEISDFRFQIWDGSVGIVGIFEAIETRRMRDRVTRRQVGHIFAGVTRAGAASERPSEEKIKSHSNNSDIADTFWI